MNDSRFSSHDCKRYWFAVVFLAIAFVVAGCSTSDDSDERDSVPPTVAIVHPLPNTTVFGEVAISISANDNVGVSRIEVYVDSILKITLITQPYQYVWNTEEYADGGLHRVFAKVYDAAGNTGQSAVVVVTIVRQVLSGYVRNSRSVPVVGAVVIVGDFSASTSDSGYYEIINLPVGGDTFQVEAEGFEKFVSLIEIPTGALEFNAMLTAIVLSQISSLSLEDQSYQIDVDWPDITSPALLGYNVYMRYYDMPSAEGLIQGIQTYYVYSEWSCINRFPVEHSEHSFSSAEYNAKYQIYVLPVNVDCVETPYSQTGTVTRSINLYLDYTQLGSFSLTDRYGPVDIPNNSNDISLLMKFEYDVVDEFNPGTWMAQISTNEGFSWTSIGLNGMTMLGGPAPAQDAGYIKSYSLNTYKGQFVYFRTFPTWFEGPRMTIVNEVREWRR